MKTQQPNKTPEPEHAHGVQPTIAPRCGGGQTRDGDPAGAIQPGLAPVGRPLLRRALAAAFLVTIAVCLVLRAQQYVVDWFTIDGGGGTSSGGSFSVTGTIGQPDAGQPLSGGPYSLVGGFWGAFAVQTPDAPRLTITSTSPGMVTISWSQDNPGWVLQASPDLTTASWYDIPQATSPYTIPVTQNRMFFRLKLP